MAAHITVEQARQLLREMVTIQVAAFDAQQRSIEALNAETRAHVDKTRNDVDKSLIDNKAAAEAYIVREVGAFKAQTETHVGHAESKVLVKKLEDFAAGVQTSIQRTQQEVVQSQNGVQTL